MSRKQLANIGLTFDQRHGRWPNVKPTLTKYLVLPLNQTIMGHYHYAY